MLFDCYGKMLDVELAAKSLKASGARMTAQRMAVLNVLADNKAHPTADEIIAQVRKNLGCVSNATIYNTLEALENLGFVRKIEGLEQCAHFDPDTSQHNHVICMKCRRVWDIDEIMLPDNLPADFRVNDVLIQGTCKECQHT